MKERKWAKKLASFKLEPIIGVQIWSTYTMGMEVYNEEENRYEIVDNRFNTEFRRSRLGVKGQPYKNLKFNITGALDFVGRDVLSATQAGANNGASPSFRIWNAFIQWKLFDNNDGLHITAGYMPPQIGRESITAALRVPSMEKSWSQNYLRRQLVGTGPGRVTGINIGGLFLNKNDKKIGFGYDLGIFNPAYLSYGGNSAGNIFSPLVAGRAVLYLGDPEFNKYTLGHKVNYFGKRNGLSIAVAGAFQGATALFDGQQTIGVDILFNWEQFNLDGEWTFMQRNKTNNNLEITANSGTGYLRMSYNLMLNKERVLEPAIKLMYFDGALSKQEQLESLALGAFAGTDMIIAGGLNYYFNPNLKLSLHYSYSMGDSGVGESIPAFNNHFFQGGAGMIRRGDWLGLGLVAIF